MMTTLPVKSPYDDHLIAEVPYADEKQVAAAMDNAHAAYLDRDHWLKPYQRYDILEKAVVIMQSRRNELAKAAAEEGGKPLIDSNIEVDRAIQGIKVALGEMSHMTGKEIPMNITLSSTGRRAFTFREPIGVVISISAFNHPLNLIVHQVIPAIAVGAPVIVKPSSSTPISCFNLVDILYEAGLPKPWCQAIVCSNQLTEQMVKDPRTSFLSFIGSAKVGWYLRSQLPAGAGCALEHGGAAPVIVEPDADLAEAIPLLVKGGFYHAGQVCVSVQRIFVHQEICSQVASNLAECAKKLIVGDPLSPDTEVGPLIAHKEVDRIEQWVNEAVQQGAKLLCGGKRLSNSCYAPTVLLNPSQSAKVSQLEVFGPVVCVYSYTDRQQAIQQANALGFSFQAAVFTKNIDVAVECVERLNATAVMVNDHTAFRVDWMPFGGRQQSGLGMGGIPYSMHDMSVEKMMVLRSKSIQ